MGAFAADPMGSNVFPALQAPIASDPMGSDAMRREMGVLVVDPMGSDAMGSDRTGRSGRICLASGWLTQA
ncbi:hypothetical protein BW13_02590 [Bifidobacterium sp. UTCIF-37]|nr:hypothetical protein BW13_02590 [Bifidobacterium sp. UTCIF-37]TPF90446.1 hypothetical protein BW11_02500 [Bifidobacterium sp. UTCIF-38]